ncbi:MAG TPA: tRNA preQ1(34) S-adenosylmethionine ribosyltransferase-isomerase QueA [Fimbriimonadaceae bacterium]|nr:tRNA preQ1(34) S-adenosylmethionine ribosyltransferase-isomerase QueA [Fimbriimonadaceae bacterium]HRJ32959.1 tRNA preQ1(34) S-adenosylmethionine ribosyltransferase-isomerase QueA [Fimbriimonadaceae bacterium]
MSLHDFDYTLPERLIAQTPLSDRAASRLLWVHRAADRTSHHTFRDVVNILEPGDLLVRNNTRVSALRLFGQKPTGGSVEALLLREAADPSSFVALLRPGRRLPVGAIIEFEEGLRAKVTQVLAEGQREIRFECATGELRTRLHDLGQAPLPPYIRTQLADPERYQTVYASQPGSSAAPTAGLHFTQELNQALAERGVQFAEVTLDVGLDTFRPIQTDQIDEHVMHGERCSVPPETAQAIAECRGRVIAVGTTTVRTLETLAQGRRQIRAGEATSKLFIQPGYSFQGVDGMFTNFHMPRTTMLLMISALVTPARIRAAYEEAIRQEYRFLSFGDSMLIL